MKPCANCNDDVRRRYARADAKASADANVTVLAGGATRARTPMIGGPMYHHTRRPKRISLRALCSPEFLA